MRKVVEPFTIIAVTVIYELPVANSLTVSDCSKVVSTIRQHKQTFRTTCLHFLEKSTEIGAISEDNLTLSFWLSVAPFTTIIGSILNQLEEGILSVR